jgi:hypothetical protein
MGYQICSILINVHKPSQITHLKTNGEQIWLKLVQINSYPRQKCVQNYNKNKDREDRV